MEKLDRRFLLGLGATAAATPALAWTTPAASQTYGPDEGEELVPGVRQVDLDKREAIIPEYQTVSMRDIVVEPGAEIPSSAMENDMVCHMAEGELQVVQNGKEFTARTGDVWTCATGTEEGGKNTSDSVAIMRVTDLLRA